MPIIPAQPQPEPKETVSLRLDCVLHERLKQYCAFIRSPKDYVIGEALRQLFRKDREFAAWSEAGAKGETPVPTSDTSGAVAAAASVAPRAQTEKSA